MQPIELTDLPNEIQERIYEFLLDAKSIRDETNEIPKPFYPSYSYSTAILRVCKSINSIAKRVFAGNHFLASLTIYRIWSRDWRISHFKDHHLRLHLQSNSSSKNIDFVIVSLDNAVDLVWMLQASDIADSCRWRLKFDVKTIQGSPLPLAVQRRLFEPFFELRGVQKCSIQGSVDPMLQHEVQDRLRARLHWKRARAWTLIDILARKLSIANQLAACGDLMNANNHYTAFVVQAPSAAAVLQELQVDDDILHRSFDRILSLIIINHAKTSIREARKHWPALRPGIYGEIIKLRSHVHPEVDCTRDEKAVYYRLLTISHLALGNLETAAAILVRSKTDYKNGEHFEQVRQTLTHYRKCHARGRIQNEMKPLHIDIGPPIEFTLPAEIFPAKVSESRTVEYERYTLTKMGYTGPLLEDRVVQKPGWTFSPVTQCTYEGTLDKNIADEYAIGRNQFIAAKEAEVGHGLKTIFGIDMN